jgi:hypothetical protein
MIGATDEAKHRALFIEHREELERQLQRSVKSGSAFENLVGIVMDGDSEFLGPALRQRGKRGKLGVVVTILSRKEALRLVPPAPLPGCEFRDAISTPSPNTFHVLVVASNSLSLSAIETKQSAPGRHHARAEEQLDGDFLLNASGILRCLYEMDEQDIADAKNGERIRRFQERARGLVNAEIIRVQPRTIDDILYDEFRGDAIVAKLRKNDAEGALDIVFSMCATS